MNLFSVVIAAFLVLLGVGLLLVIYRFIKGPTLPDRVTAFDLFTAFVIAIIALFSIIWDNNVFLDVAVIISLIAFLGAMSFAFYLNKRKKE
ncbi:MAG TPA: monovalent cation/H+ antiporter complex subunit F [Tenuifilaceae bacterium]|nr:monovalent cation/H+ antiporter complex subunit F [Tenuifilaceae bacterium]HPE17374.1 monovalent cation/H+ antiporter complex subunit F [Tenuifilaceae bacterium]HPJ45804.1 monovalent cation/H+ antiporter complex subunit F [Tenuifilaceae bacterium]HPQ33519.1 monovalent cation/H+ antiporter complex subunit F [Tenuifilaceae bacterium]HRX66848.1 monovalent cation/H+ antiporter complex subunit F [Tenuifilaceae bacterium]